MIKEARPLAILDTHIWIWLLSNHPKVQSTKFLKTIRAYEAQKGLRVSVISIWEIGVLCARGRIELPFNVHRWVEKALSPSGIFVAELTPDIALDSTQLNSEFPGDPADRIILTTAKSLGGILVTADQKMLKYARRHHLETVSL